MQETIARLKEQFSSELNSVATTDDLEALKVKYLGKKGPVQELMKELRMISEEQRPHAGKLINDFKEQVSETLISRQSFLANEEENARLPKEKIDITLPGRRRYSGRKHIVTQVLDELIDIMRGMGFSVQYGPDIETDYYNFEALNFPADHPARDMQDTFYLSPTVLLRTHTSNVQTRVMEVQKPPIRIIAPGKVYRNETITARSHVFFHQVEALYVDIGVTFADLLATMKEFLTKVFQEAVEVRFRPSYFPFVEPGMEIDIKCLSCRGAGCGLCKHSGWLEVGGAGMVHPEVLKNSDIDPEVYSGFAWGMGVERLILLKYGVNDIRMLTENDLRFLRQFTNN